MGSGNAYVGGEYEGLYYLDWDAFKCPIIDEDGNETDYRDYDMERLNFEMFLGEEFIPRMIELFPSLTKLDKWLKSYTRREQKAILENELFYIAIEDNEWSLAFELIQKEDEYYDTYSKVGLQKRHYERYLEGIKDVLKSYSDLVYVRTSAWTSEKVE